MPELIVTLITGRSTKQGVGISTGKGSPDYQEAIGTVELNPQDMASAGLGNGDRVILTSEHGSVEAKCVSGELPEGLAFMAFGPACNQLIGSETHASGMPDSKQVRVEVRMVTWERRLRDDGDSGN